MGVEQRSVLFRDRDQPLPPGLSSGVRGGDRAGGVILAFVVDDLEGELTRLQDDGVAITMPLTEEQWGERAFQVRDPNGVIVQLLDWNAAVDGVAEI